MWNASAFIPYFVNMASGQAAMTKRAQGLMSVDSQLIHLV
jgi:hypothetical protein